MVTVKCIIVFGHLVVLWPGLVFSDSLSACWMSVSFTLLSLAVELLPVTSERDYQ